MRLFKASLLLLSILMPLTTSAQNKIFPYKYFTDDLPNGLRVITIPTDYPNIVALYIVVGTGSRNEVEPGKSAFPHLFEHLMFPRTDKLPTSKHQTTINTPTSTPAPYT